MLHRHSSPSLLQSTDIQQRICPNPRELQFRTWSPLLQGREEGARRGRSSSAPTAALLLAWSQDGNRRAWSPHSSSLLCRGHCHSSRGGNGNICSLLLCLHLDATNRNTTAQLKESNRKKISSVRTTGKIQIWLHKHK